MVRSLPATSATPWRPSACKPSAAKSPPSTPSTTVPFFPFPSSYSHTNESVTGNHVGYGRFTGRKSSPSEVSDLYTGLKSSGLSNFHILLSGYCPSAALVEEIGKIARERKLESATSPGSFFWILDPVMGDNGRIYVAEDTVPAYRGLLRDADLILPNQFEAELLSGVQITDLESMTRAIEKLHTEHHVPHVLITSIRFPSSGEATPEASEDDLTSTGKLSVIGSSATSNQEPRLFRITIPSLPVYFSGTGDMFAATLVARLRQAALQAGVLGKPNWRSEDGVRGPDLPLAKATEKVLASMHAVLEDTAEHYAKAKADMEGEGELSGGVGVEAGQDKEVERHLRLTRAAEVRVVRNARMLVHPPDLEQFKAQAIESGGSA
ncbi:putative pyridoxal kinase [Saxophila tyrrhenica]|uniref:pyridoxal kinase n=1 Tax=Saxophila tyrrhenica TaxID=1690608 RepID=A0AAV9PIL2_9PEZI|nr:putative pyridoxal kinase [Saxophila tyrrhenica]